MPRIQAFQGILPTARLAEKVVVELENYTLQEARILRKKNPYSFIHMLAPKLDNPFQMGSKVELAYKTINANFEEFLSRGILLQDTKPSIYIYQIKHRGIAQTGIWTTTSIDDYQDNIIKKHEATLPEREKKLVEYLQNTGLDTNPVLITYPEHPQINSIIAKYVAEIPLLCFKKKNSEHMIWCIDDEKVIEELSSLFLSLPAVYIADGHHRAAAATSFALKRRKINMHAGTEGYNFFSSVYMATDQVTMFEFNRMVKDLAGLSTEEFLAKLESKFILKKSQDNEQVKPATANTLGMYLKGVWYELRFPGHILEEQSWAQQLNVEILQALVLDPLLNIKDPRQDPRIGFSSGKSPLSDLTKQVDDEEYAALFTLAPIEIWQLISVAESGKLMPPKSTYFEPKFLLGLITHWIRS